jgi:hypothetical protein
MTNPHGSPFALSPRGKPFPLTPAMIARRDSLALALGYVRRPCSFGPPDDGKPHRECWERPGLDHIHRGCPVSSLHVVPFWEDDRGTCYQWPEDAEVAAWAIDKGKPMAGDAEDGPGGTAGPVGANEVQAELFVVER